MKVRTNVQVLNGLPLQVVAEVEPADPEVGYNYPYIEDMHFETMRGHRARWAEKKMSSQDYKNAERAVWMELQSMMDGEGVSPSSQVRLNWTLLV